MQTKKSAILFYTGKVLYKTPSVQHGAAPALDIPQIGSTECSGLVKTNG